MSNGDDLRNLNDELLAEIEKLTEKNESQARQIADLTSKQSESNLLITQLQAQNQSLTQKLQQMSGQIATMSGSDKELQKAKELNEKSRRESLSASEKLQSARQIAEKAADRNAENEQWTEFLRQREAEIDNEVAQKVKQGANARKAAAFAAAELTSVSVWKVLCIFFAAILAVRDWRTVARTWKIICYFPQTVFFFFSAKVDIDTAKTLKWLVPTVFALFFAVSLIVCVKKRDELEFDWRKAIVVSLMAYIAPLELCIFAVKDLNLFNPCIVWALIPLLNVLFSRDTY